ncbi:MAG: prephenate dehydratase [Phycisphaerales bacterium]|nr:prephenate dehydratase [Phycisphaerales bacterium]
MTSEDEMPIDLDALRIRIDALDEQLVRLLSERAAIVEEVGRVKRVGGTPVYAPHRERAVLERVRSLNPGPLSGRTLEAIWRELMSGSFGLEQPLTIGYLGPAGSFSHLAALRHFGSSVEVAEAGDIDSVFRSVMTGSAHYGLVPYENSIVGSITDTLDAFVEYEIGVCAESLIEVSHCLLANCEHADIKRLASKPQVLSQCRKWIQRHLPGVELIPTASSAAGVEDAATEAGTAAIGSRLAASIYSVNVLAEQIGDKPDNITRFLVLGRQRPEPTDADRTSIMFTTKHAPGALVDVLAVFRDAGINLSHIDKRPSGRVNWEYTFFIDADRHRDDPPMVAAIAEATDHCVLLRVLGSYPRAEGVL